MAKFFVPFVGAVVSLNSAWEVICSEWHGINSAFLVPGTGEKRKFRGEEEVYGGTFRFPAGTQLRLEKLTVNRDTNTSRWAVVGHNLRINIENTSLAALDGNLVESEQEFLQKKAEVKKKKKPSVPFLRTLWLSYFGILFDPQQSKHESDRFEEWIKLMSECKFLHKQIAEHAMEPAGSWPRIESLRAPQTAAAAGIQGNMFSQHNSFASVGGRVGADGARLRSNYSKTEAIELVTSELADLAQSGLAKPAGQVMVRTNPYHGNHAFFEYTITRDWDQWLYPSNEYDAWNNSWGRMAEKQKCLPAGRFSWNALKALCMPVYSEVLEQDKLVPNEFARTAATEHIAIVNIPAATKESAHFHSIGVIQFVLDMTKIINEAGFFDSGLRRSKEEMKELIGVLEQVIAAKTADEEFALVAKRSQKRYGCFGMQSSTENQSDGDCLQGTEDVIATILDSLEESCTPKPPKGVRKLECSHANLEICNSVNTFNALHVQSLIWELVRVFFDGAGMYRANERLIEIRPVLSENGQFMAFHPGSVPKMNSSKVLKTQLSNHLSDVIQAAIVSEKSCEVFDLMCKRLNALFSDFHKESLKHKAALGILWLGIHKQKANFKESDYKESVLVQDGEPMSTFRQKGLYYNCLEGSAQ